MAPHRPCPGLSSPPACPPSHSGAPTYMSGPRLPLAPSFCHLTGPKDTWMGITHHAAVCCPQHLQVRACKCAWVLGPQRPAGQRAGEALTFFFAPPLHTTYHPHPQVGSPPSPSSVCGAREVVKIYPSQAPIIVGETQGPAGHR